MTDTLDREEFLAGYVAEAQEHLASARRCLVALDEALRHGHAAPRPIRELFRALHTIKGLSGMIGAEPIVDVAHAMESVTRGGDRAGGRLRHEAVDALLGGVREIEDRVARVARGEPLAPAPPALLEAFAVLEGAAAQAPPRSVDLPDELAQKLGAAELEQIAEGLAAGRRALRVDFFPSPERASRGLDITAARQRVAELGEIVKVLPRTAGPGEHAPAGLVFVLIVITASSPEALAAAVEAPPESVHEVQVSGAGTPPPPDLAAEPVEELSRGFVRVDVARLDDALERVSALVVSRARLSRAVEGLAAAGVDVRALAPLLQDHGRELKALRGAVMRARLVRLAEVLERTPLLVRGLARTSGKQVRLALEVGDAEVDKAVGERLFPALVHLLRNAVDHAVEPPDERRRRGKPEEATVRVTCAYRGEGRLEIAVSDDGRGIDVEAVARKAGAPPPGTGPELLDLLARPGLSTLSAATRTSGRGIGMDVVRRVVVNDLGGALDVRTERGAGTTFTLRVPLSVTILDGLTFECAGETYVVPTGAVDELVEIDPADLVGGPGPFRGGAAVRMLRWRDRSVPYLELRDVLGIGRGGAGRRGIIFSADGLSFGFGVDRMIGRQEVVIRPVSDPLVERAGISGATDLGDGRPTLVLDLAALSRTLTPTAGGRA